MTSSRNFGPCRGHDSSQSCRLEWVVRFLGVLVAILALPCASTAQSDAPTPLNWSPNKIVRTVAEADGRLYVTGDFDRIAPITGSLAVLDKVVGEVRRSPVLPRIGGTVNAIAPDGLGGWYVAGIFDLVGSVPARNLAHILVDGSVDPNWLPAANGEVKALVVSGNRVFVAGEFTKIRKKKRFYLAALDARTGKVLAWRSDTDEIVTALAVHGRRLFVGGRFAYIGGVRRNGLAAVTTDSGALESWDPQPSDIARISDFAVGEDKLYFVGSFDKIGGQPRNCIAAVDPESGVVTSWDANSRQSNPELLALALYNGTLYVGGVFHDLGGERHVNIAALDGRTGKALVWSAAFQNRVTTLAADSGLVYAGGYSSGTTAVAFDAQTGEAAEWNAHSNGYIEAIAVTEDAVALAGTFTMAGGVERLGLAALDSRTGEPLDWVPRLGGAPLGSRINTIAVRGSSVFIGGEFTSVNGQARVNLAELDAHTGGLKPLDIQPDNSVRAFAIDGSTLYVGGLFHLVDPDHVQRNGIIAIDLEQGVLSSFAPAAQDETGGRIEDIAVDADTVYVSGRFDFMDGVVRHNIAAINKHTGRVTSWDPRATGPDWCTLIVVAGQTVYVAGRFGEIGGKPDRWIAAVDRTTAAVSDWNPILSEGRHFTGLVVRGQIVFLAGSFLDYDHDGVRTGLCAVDTTSGALLPWNPDPDQGVIALITTTDRLIAVGGFTKFKENPSIANHVVTFELEPPTKQVPTTGAK